MNPAQHLGTICLALWSIAIPGWFTLEDMLWAPPVGKNWTTGSDKKRSALRLDFGGACLLLHRRCHTAQTDAGRCT
jgi:hypothetical protein